MPISIYDNTTPKDVPLVFVNIEDTWKGCDTYANVGGTWKTILERLIVPSGLILLSQDGTIPSGWTRYTAADNKFIVGAGSTYAVNSTGGSTTISGSLVTSTSNGAHSADIHAGGLRDDSGSGYTRPVYSVPTTAGDHTHTGTAINYYLPNKQKMVLIKATSSSTKLPASSMALSTEDKANFSTFSGSGGYLYGSSSNAYEVFSTNTLTTSSSGSHTHGSTTVSTGGSYVCKFGTFGSAHSTHVITVTPTNNYSKCSLRGVYTSAVIAPVAGLIGLWDGSSAPPYWSFCDGNNGTINLQDYFIKIDALGDGTVTVGTDEVVFDYLFSSVSWNHYHTDDKVNPPAEGDTSTRKGLNPANSVHSHTASATYSYTPPYYALHFIQYTG